MKGDGAVLGEVVVLDLPHAEADWGISGRFSRLSKQISGIAPKVGENVRVQL